MKSAVAIAIDGVLRREIGYQPIPQGLVLYRALAQTSNIVLLGNQDDPGYVAEVEHFYHNESVYAHSKTMYGDYSQPFLAAGLMVRRVRQAMRLRNSGMALDFIVEADPVLSAALFNHGFNVMHFMHAQYARPDWRPGFEHKVVPWDELVRQETEIKTVRQSDTRIDS